MYPTSGNVPYAQLTASEYAAIMLKVPTSGTAWLDRMITTANERDMKLIGQVHAQLAAIAKAVKCAAGQEGTY